MPLNYVNCSFIFLLATALIGSLIPLSKRFDFTDKSGRHKKHTGEIPYLGGVGIFLVLTLFGGIYFVTKFNQVNPKSFPYIYIYALGVIVFFIGLVDDLKGVDFSYKIKLLIQVLATISVIIKGPEPVFFGIKYLDQVIIFFWIIGLTNSFNLLDNMDNFSSATALSTIIVLGTFAYIVNAQTLFYFLILMGIVILAFIPWNFDPAKIYLGDSGSLFIGFLLSSFSLMLMEKIQGSYELNHSIFALFMIAPAFTIPITDTLSVMIIRIKNNHSPFHGDNNHLSHRIVRNNFSKRSGVYTLVGINILAGATGLIMYKVNSGTISLIILISIILGMTILSFKLGKVQFKH